MSFSIGAKFHLDGDLNAPKSNIWETGRPIVVMEVLLHTREGHHEVTLSESGALCPLSVLKSGRVNGGDRREEVKQNTSSLLSALEASEVSPHDLLIPAG